MVSKAPGVVRQGTADDLAKTGDGLSANGVSQYTRESAHAANRLKTPSYRERRGQWTRTEQEKHAFLIRRSEIELGRLRDKLEATRDNDRRKKYSSDIAIKTGFIAKLKSEIQ